MKKLFVLIGILIFHSCEEITEVPDISDETLTVLAPTDGVTLSTTSVTFNWNAVEDADNYRLQIATPNFTEAQQIVIDSLTPELNLNITLETSDYQWRVRAENSDFQTAYTTQSFTVEE